VRVEMSCLYALNLRQGAHRFSGAASRIAAQENLRTSAPHCPARSLFVRLFRAVLCPLCCASAVPHPSTHGPRFSRDFLVFAAPLDFLYRAPIALFAPHFRVPDTPEKLWHRP
jgi:hypothetical protein